MIRTLCSVLALAHLISTPSLAAAQWTVFEDVMYWHASQQPTSTWAYQFSLNTNNVNDPLSQGTNFVEPNIYFGWSAGLRLGVAQTPEAYFDKKIYWTHFSTKTGDAITVPVGQYLLPQFFNGFTTTSVYNMADIQWNIEMNQIDAKMGHRFYPQGSVMLHPSVGVKGATIRQSIHSSWQMNELGFVLYQATENLKNNFSGIGPVVGLDARWEFFKGLSLLGDFEAALLWGHWRISDDFYRPNSLFYAEKTIQSLTSDTLGSFMTGYFLGLEWAFEFKAQVKIKAGYELQFWANQLRLPIFQALPIHGDLTLQGATCGISITL